LVNLVWLWIYAVRDMLQKTSGGAMELDELADERMAFMAGGWVLWCSN
jgi:hypothetical protein